MLARLLRPSEVAQILGVSRSFSYQLIRSGELPYIRIGRSVRVRPEDLEAFVRLNKAGQDLSHLMPLPQTEKQ